MKKIALTILSLLTLGLIIISCEGGEIKKETFKHKETIDMDHGLFNYNSIIEGDAHSGKKFSRANAGNNFSLGYSYQLPDSLKGKSIAVNVTGWVRTGDLTNTCDIAVTATSNDSILLWTGCNIKEFIKNANEWTQISRSITFTPDITSKGNVYFNVMGHNIDAKSFFDMDDLNVEYVEVVSVNEPAK
jgi:hypothetical protein